MSKKTQFGFVVKKVEVDRAINLTSPYDKINQLSIKKNNEA